MNKKYIVTLADEYALVHKLTVPVTINGKHTAWIQTDINLTPYTEPDLEQVRKEAYEQGLSDAWEAARKIIYMPEADLLNLFTECYAAVCTSVQVFLKYDASECIEKIRAYEQEQEKIKVGDEIETPSGLKGYVVNFTDDELVHYVSSEGRFGTIGMSAVSKTGRHFPEIAEVLAKMKES